MGSLAIVKVIDIAEWEALVTEFEGSPMINSGWLLSIADPERRPVYFKFIRDGEAVGIIGGLEIAPSSNIMDKLGIYRTLFFFTGIMPKDPSDISYLTSELIRYSKKVGYGNITIRPWDYPHTYEIDSNIFKMDVRDEYIIPISEDFSTVRKNVKKTVRRYANQAERKGVSFHESRSPELIDVLFSLIDRTKEYRMRRGINEYSHKYIPHIDEMTIASLLECGLGRFFYAEKDGEILSITFYVSNGMRAFGIYIGTNEKGYSLHANDFLTMKVLEVLSKEGVRSLSIGGLPREGKEGLRYYKMSVGAVEESCQGGKSDFLQGIHQKIPLLLIKKMRGKNDWGKV